MLIANAFLQKHVQAINHKHEIVIQELRSELDKNIHREEDLLIRKRELYTKLAVSMRVFLSRMEPISIIEKKKFLECYDEMFLWASDEVIFWMKQFIDIQKVEYRADDKQEKSKTCFSSCVLAMRKDAGFSKTTTGVGDYDFVSFL